VTLSVTKVTKPQAGKLWSACALSVLAMSSRWLAFSEQLRVTCAWSALSLFGRRSARLAVQLSYLTCFSVPLIPATRETARRMFSNRL